MLSTMMRFNRCPRCYTNGRLLPCIKVLDLSDNFLTDEGLEYNKLSQT